MSVLLEIVTWAQDLSGWQADALRRLVKHGELDATDEEEVLAMLRNRYQLLADGEKAKQEQRPSRRDISAHSDSISDIRLLAMKQLKHVNAIANQEPLRFGVKGLTVIYGKNASGKSGYARVLKRACRARDTKEPVHSDVYGEANSASPSATIELEIDQKSREVQWEEGKDSPSELKNFAVFDSRCARIYVDNKNDVIYVPYGMDIFQKLVDLCDRYRAILTKDRAEIDTKPTFLEEFNSKTEAGALVAGLNADSSFSRFEGKARLNEKEKNRCHELEKMLKQAESDSPKARAVSLRRVKSRVEKLNKDLNSLLDGLSEVNVEALKKLSDKCSSTAEAARLASEVAFKGFPLRGVGSDPWRRLFEAAKTYSEEVAYPGKDFPVIEVDSKCVLCQQDLDDSAKKRFSHFQKFVVNKVASAAKEARIALEKKRKEFADLAPNIEKQHEDALKEVTELNKIFSDELDEVLNQLPLRHAAIQQALNDNQWTNIPQLCEFDTAKFQSLADTIETEAMTFDELGGDELTKLRNEHAELSQRQLLSKHLGRVRSLLKCLKKRERLEKCIGELDTGRITLKSSRLMETVTTEALRKGLESELEHFGIERLQVSINKSGGKGITFHQLKIPKKSGTRIPLSDILSEGEHRVVALSSFLAELNTGPDRRGIIFDDPVSSLDHEFREIVAKRLVQEAEVRQVIVFTHDIVFLLAVERYAANLQVPLMRKEIKREGMDIGIPVDALPWPAQNINGKLGYLKRLLQEDVKRSQKDSEKYKIQVGRFYGLLREAWERTIEEILLNDTIQRFRPSIETQRLKGVSVTDDDYRVIEQEMTKCSTHMAGHDSAPAELSTVRPIDELEKDLNKLDTFSKERRSKADKTQSLRKAAISPPSVESSSS